MKHAVLIAALLFGACSFDRSGVGNGDDDQADDDGPRPDAEPPGPPDARRPDAAPPDAEPPDAEPDFDLDDDGVLDIDDNCVAADNVDQHDEDSDGVGDVCDNCPHLGNTGQEDTTEVESGSTADGVGDLCDPGKDTRERIALFEPFSGDSVPTTWTTVGGTWNVANDALHQTSLVSTSATAFYNAESADWDNLTLHTFMTVDGFAPDGAGSDVRSFGPMVFYAPGAGPGNGYQCMLRDDVSNGENTALQIAKITDAGGSAALTGGDDVGSDLAANQSFFGATSATPGSIGCFAFTLQLFTQTSSDTSYTEGSVGLRTNRAQVSFRYVVVFSPTL